MRKLTTSTSPRSIFGRGRLPSGPKKKSIARDTVIVATGASARWLGVPGEDVLRGRGVSTCATCDGAFFKEKEIVVVGGGDSAMEEALFLTRFGKQVTVIHRRRRCAPARSWPSARSRIRRSSFIWNTVVEEVHGEQVVEWLALRNVDTGETARIRGRRAVHRDRARSEHGDLPRTAGPRRAGYIVSHDGVHTNVEGVFVAGDVYDIRYKQAITAAGNGLQSCARGREIPRAHRCIPRRNADGAGLRIRQSPMRGSGSS